MFLNSGWKLLSTKVSESRAHFLLKGDVMSIGHILMTKHANSIFVMMESNDRKIEPR